MRAAVREITLSERAFGGAAGHLLRGHPWVWQDSIARGFGGVLVGEEVQVNAADGSAVGRGFADPTSPIAVRLWTRHRKPIDPPLWQSRAARACAVRAVLFERERTTAFRVVHGEGDRMPGFVVDRYGPVAVVRTDGEAAASRVRDFAVAIGPILETQGVRSLVHRTGTSKKKGEAPRFDLLRGEAPPDTVRVEENGVPFAVDLKHGQKTGAFLDQRENRRRVGELACGRRVLNLFSYAGGFSLHAALGGATHVTSVDIAAAGHATAQVSFRMADLDPGAHTFVAADVGSFLASARARGQTWDLVISDPPSFAPSDKTLPRALSAYRALHRGCIEVLAPAGLLCAASCSSHVDAPSFLGTLDDAALGGRELSILELRGAGSDHPTLAGFPEGRYLKFAILT